MKIDYIAERVGLVLSHIKSAALRAKRDPASITIVAVSKKQSVELISVVVSLLKKSGVSFVLGENYVQEWRDKSVMIEGVDVHLIGPLQTNKSKEAVQLFKCIESVDSLKLAQELNKRAEKIAKIQDIFLQVNISNDANKHGLDQASLLEFINNILPLKALRLRGLMAITQYYEKSEEVRADYRKMRELADSLYLNKDIASYLEYHSQSKLLVSMGMSSDYQIAIEEGADIVRIGTAFFGEREY